MHSENFEELIRNSQDIGELAKRYYLNFLFFEQMEMLCFNLNCLFFC